METHFPSGENRPFDSPSPNVICRSLLCLSFPKGICFCTSAAPPPAIGATQRWFALVFFSSDTSVTENITHFPLGEICGSLTRFIAIMSANVIGLFAATGPAVPAAPCPVAAPAPRPATTPAHTNATATRRIFIPQSNSLHRPTTRRRAHGS
jgi:hypothetical protein